MGWQATVVWQDIVGVIAMIAIWALWRRRGWARRSGPRLSEALEEALRIAYQRAEQAEHERVTLEHLIAAFCEDPECAALFEACGADPATLRAGLEELVDQLPGRANRTPPSYDGALQIALQRAAIHATSAQQGAVASGDVVAAALLETESPAGQILIAHGVKRLDFLYHMSHRGVLADEPWDDPTAACQVYLHNDHYTTREFVVEILQSVFGKSTSEAERIMLAVHKRGSSPVAAYPAELAASKVAEATARAHAQGFPLRCSLEPALIDPEQA